jgi:hypothetical protein
VGQSGNPVLTAHMRPAIRIIVPGRSGLLARNDRVLAEGPEPVQAAARMLFDEEVDSATPIVCSRIGGQMSGQRLVPWQGSRCRGGQTASLVTVVEHRPLSEVFQIPEKVIINVLPSVPI